MQLQLSSYRVGAKACWLNYRPYSIALIYTQPAGLLLVGAAVGGGGEDGGL